LTLTCLAGEKADRKLDVKGLAESNSEVMNQNINEKFINKKKGRTGDKKDKDDETENEVKDAEEPKSDNKKKEEQKPEKKSKTENLQKSDKKKQETSKPKQPEDSDDDSSEKSKEKEKSKKNK
jgi:CCR4-NOT transcription complex subunit 4